MRDMRQNAVEASWPSNNTSAVPQDDRIHATPTATHARGAQTEYMYMTRLFRSQTTKSQHMSEVYLHA